MNVRSNRLFGWALALSLAAHAIVLYFAQNLTFSQAAPPPQPLRRMTIARIVPPTPPPTPRPTATPRPKPARPQAPPRRAVAVAPPVLAHPAAPVVGPPVGRPPVGAPDVGDDVQATGSPQPSAPPEPACSDPQAQARAIDPVVPETPQSAFDEGATGTTLVRVALDAQGAVTGVSIYRSSGWRALDLAAEAAARQTAYRPQLQDCVPVAGEYIFSAQFLQ